MRSYFRLQFFFWLLLCSVVYGCYVDTCLLYTSDAADDQLCVELGGRRIIQKKKNKTQKYLQPVWMVDYNIDDNNVQLSSLHGLTVVI